MAVRRVVTGHDAAGKAVFVSDDEVVPVTPTLLPGSEFVRFGLFTIPPDGGDGAPADLDVAAALAELEEQLPGLAGHMEPDDPGMHTTATIDFEVVLSGSVTLELDDGEKVCLVAGDTVVQNGTRHRWSNAGDEPATLAVFICGAHHDRV
jgi:mannose-6-phosphate isomerase-like protein (cupin superfamily)